MCRDPKWVIVTRDIKYINLYGVDKKYHDRKWSRQKIYCPEWGRPSKSLRSLAIDFCLYKF